MPVQTNSTITLSFASMVDFGSHCLVRGGVFDQQCGLKSTSRHTDYGNLFTGVTLLQVSQDADDCTDGCFCRVFSFLTLKVVHSLSPCQDCFQIGLLYRVCV